MTLNRFQSGPFYTRIRPFVFICKAMATFPLQNIQASDGRELKHRWCSAIFLYDIIVCLLIGTFFSYTSYCLVQEVKGQDDKFYLVVWLYFTALAAGSRNFCQFVLCHYYAHKYPQLLTALEDYYQGIGTEILESRRYVFRLQLIPILRTVFFLIILTAASYSFFIQFHGSTWVACASYVLINLWKELPMSMFICICAHLRPRFDQLVLGLAKIRESDDSPESVKRLENLRLQYAAMMNILGILQKCYGMQLAFNILFFILDTILQLFIFFVFTSSQNILLLTLSVYFFIAACGVIFYIDRLERKMEGLLDALNAFELEGKSLSLKYQLKLFITQIAARPIKISASGFCLINNTLIAGLFGAIATYLIVMLNFAPYIVEWANDTMITRRQPQWQTSF
ncbi:uncharacterized protein LOC132197761 [Neocloeon triangulifer]|uniref:uncharacterized protein LOC132197761 n=1 Tax=Neocloeon triangulifer TaxID=2078957 RepID=UPI00286F5F94|nr:uncharacterized protein LOC132197761 [Neocloeon triangulifer]